MFFALYFTGRFFVEYFKEYQAWAVGLPNGDVAAAD